MNKLLSSVLALLITPNKSRHCLYNDTHAPHLCSLLQTVLDLEVETGRPHHIPLMAKKIQIQLDLKTIGKIGLNKAFPLTASEK